MATISGKYLLKRQISLLADAQNVLFTSNSVPYTQMSVTRSTYLTVFTYYNSTTEVSSGVYTWFNEVTGEGSWNNTEYQILDFGSSAQTVSNAFSSWLSNNAYPIASTEYILRVNDVQTSEYQGQLVRCIIKNGTAYRIKDQQAYIFTLNFASGCFRYSVRYDVYDGQDDTGTLLGSSQSTSETVSDVCTTGYIYVKLVPRSSYAAIIMDADWDGTHTGMEIEYISSDSAVIQITSDDVSGTLSLDLD